jgi:RNA-directed DNA polymerase
MRSVTQFLEGELRIKVNREKSAVDHPWNRKFLGYSLTREKEPRLKVAAQSVERFKDKLREFFAMGRGWSLSRLIGVLNPRLRGWINYFRLTQIRNTIEELDGWIRRKLRAVVWRQWKTRDAREANLRKYGLKPEQAKQSARNGRGPWWNAGASHMNAAFRKPNFDKLGLVSLSDRHQCLGHNTL